jgi:hypothetical protein
LDIEFAIEIMDKYVKIIGVIWDLIINVMPFFDDKFRGFFFKSLMKNMNPLCKNIMRSLFQKFNEKYEFHDEGE